MGYSISEATHKRQLALIARGRDCRMDRCRALAHVVVHQRSWAYKVNEGAELTNREGMTFCRKHAAWLAPGTEGVNYIVTAHEQITPEVAARLQAAVAARNAESERQWGIAVARWEAAGKPAGGVYGAAMRQA